MIEKTERQNRRIRKGDTVMALNGNDRGQKGTVLSLVGERVVVQGLNVRKKCVRKSEANPAGGIVDRECGIHISNLRLCVDDEPVKVKAKINRKGEKELIYKKEGKEVLYRQIKKPAK